MEVFAIYGWPGNIRELRNVLERAVILTAEGEIPMKNLPQHIAQLKPAETPKPAETLRPVGTREEAAPVVQAVAAAAAGSMVVPPAATAVAVTEEPVRTERGDNTLEVPIGTTVEEAEKNLILRTLEHTRNNKTRAAEILGISLKTLHNKLKEYGARDIV
jgi:DNA-binding NtrC family response regulator